jgi:H+-transporting ATPase
MSTPISVLIRTCIEYEGEEYDVLLRYVNEQKETLKNKGGGEEEDEDKDAKYTRKWYMPWKKVKMDSGKRRVGERRPRTSDLDATSNMDGYIPAPEPKRGLS